MMPRLPFVGMPSYGVLVALGFVAALLLAWRLAPRFGLSAHAVQDVLVWGALWGIIGAKLLLIVVDPKAFFAAPWSILVQGGVFYGGVVVGGVAGWLRAARLGLDPWAVADVVGPCVALSHVFGRIGCFLAGCCHGVACDAPWAVHYSSPLSIPMQNGVSPEQGLHPTQLYEAVANIGLLVMLLCLIRRRAFAGQIWWIYVGSYALVRGLVEFLRGDARGSIRGVPTSQAIACVAFLASIVMLMLLQRRAARSRGEAPPSPIEPTAGGAAP